MEGNMGISFHGYKENISFLVKQGWIEQTNNQGTTYKYCPRVAKISF